MSNSAMRYIVLDDPKSSPVYYSLRTRGLSERQARSLISDGWTAEKHAVVFFDALLRKSPLSLILGALLKAAPGATKILDIEELKSVRAWLYDKWKDDPGVRAQMERAGWGGDRSKEAPSAMQILLGAMAGDYDNTTVGGGGQATFL